MRLKFEPSSKPLHNSANQLFLNRELYLSVVHGLAPPPLHCIQARGRVGGEVAGASPLVRCLRHLPIFMSQFYSVRARRVDIRLPGKENSKSHGARPVFSNCLDDYVDSDQ